MKEECPRDWCSFGVFCTDLSSNKRVWFLWVADSPASKLLQFFHFEVWFNGISFCNCWKAYCSSYLPSPSRNMKANIWKNCCLKDVSCPPWKYVGVCRCPECHEPVHRGGGGPGPELLFLWCWPAPRSCWNQHLPPPAAVWPHCCPHNSVNKVCALFETASTPCFLSGSLALFKGLSHLKKCQRTSLVIQWLGIHLPVQGTWVQSLVGEDLTRRDNQVRALPQEKPPQWEALTPQLESSPCLLQLEKAGAVTKTQCRHWINKYPLT